MQQELALASGQHKRSRVGPWQEADDDSLGLTQCSPLRCVDLHRQKCHVCKDVMYS